MHIAVITMTFEEFCKTHRPVRHFQRYSSEQRANMRSSHRLGYRQKQAVGEFFYTTELLPNIAFGTAKAAKQGAYEAYLKIMAG